MLVFNLMSLSRCSLTLQRIRRMVKKMKTLPVTRVSSRSANRRTVTRTPGQERRLSVCPIIHVLGMLRSESPLKRTKKRNSDSSPEIALSKSPPFLFYRQTSSSVQFTEKFFNCTKCFHQWRCLFSGGT